MTVYLLPHDAAIVWAARHDTTKERFFKDLDARKRLEIADGYTAEARAAWLSFPESARRVLRAFLYAEILPFKEFDEMSAGARGSVSKTLLIPAYRQEWEGAQ